MGIKQNVKNSFCTYKLYIGANYHNISKFLPEILIEHSTIFFKLAN
jgi:hypothetical protein